MAMLSPDEVLLAGRVAVITGASAGVGRAVAETFASFGAQLALCDRTRPDGVPGLDEDRQGGSQVERRLLGAGAVGASGAEAKSTLAMTVDPRDAMAVEVFVNAVAERYGRADVLVNIGDQALIDDHLTRLTGLTTRLLPLMGPGSSIINVISAEAAETAVSAAISAAIESLTRSLAVELAPRGIRVNAIAPGDPRRSAPLGSPGEPSAVAAAAVFLAGAMAGSVTGTTLRVDGGLHARRL